MAERKKVLLRLDPAVHDALARWAADELRSTNAQIEFLLRRALTEAGRMPRSARAMRGPGRPREQRADAGEGAGHGTPADTDDTTRNIGQNTTEDAHDPPPGGNGE
ncbi:MAG TPA: hypothetical protein VIL71_00445 [Spirillospora sp.]